MRSAPIISRATVALGLFLFPYVCSANGWISGVTAFRRTPDFFVIFTAIVVVEWIVLWRALPLLGAFGAVWRVLAINVASSLAGDLLFRVGRTPESGTVWIQAIPFFFLTIAIELPLLRFFLRNRVRGWLQLSVIVLLANVASYALLIAIDRPVREAWLHRIFTADQQVIRQWTNTYMLREATGRIYATESRSGGPPHQLRYFDLKDQRWYSVSNSPAVDPNIWDIEGDVLAFQTYGESTSRQIVWVTTLPTCSPIRELTLPPNNYNSAGGGELAISPDQNKLAVLVPLHEIHAPLSGSSYRVPGRSCLLVVYDLASGDYSVCRRRALRAICWESNSKKVFFHSLTDEKVMSTEVLAKGWQKQFDFNNPERNEFLRPPVFSYRLDTGDVALISNTAAELISAQANQLVLLSNQSLILLNTTNGSRTQRDLGKFVSQYQSPTLSPDGRFAVARFFLNPFTSHFGYPAIVNLENSLERFSIGQVVYRVEWVDDDGRRSIP